MTKLEIIDELGCPPVKRQADDSAGGFGVLINVASDLTTVLQSLNRQLVAAEAEIQKLQQENGQLKQQLENESRIRSGLDRQIEQLEKTLEKSQTKVVIME